MRIDELLKGEGDLVRVYRSEPCQHCVDEFKIVRPMFCKGAKWWRPMVGVDADGILQVVIEDGKTWRLLPQEFDFADVDWHWLQRQWAEVGLFKTGHHEAFAVTFPEAGDVP